MKEDDPSTDKYREEMNKAFNDFFKICNAFSDEYKDTKASDKKRINCWDYFNCPPDICRCCTAFIQKAGRRCWLVAGSLSGSPAMCKVTDSGRQSSNCKNCEFYKKVKAAEI